MQVIPPLFFHFHSAFPLEGMGEPFFKKEPFIESIRLVEYTLEDQALTSLYNYGRIYP